MNKRRQVCCPSTLVASAKDLILSAVFPDKSHREIGDGEQYNKGMTTSPLLSLTADWVCDYFELDPNLYEFADGIPVPSLRGWSPEKRYDDTWAAYLQKSFALEITDVCFNYVLHVESAPLGTVVTLNNARLGQYMGKPLAIDVTDAITWDENLLAFRIVCGTTGSFSGVYLRPIACN